MLDGFQEQKRCVTQNCTAASRKKDVGVEVDVDVDVEGPDIDG